MVSLNGLVSARIIKQQLLGLRHSSLSGLMKHLFLRQKYGRFGRECRPILKRSCDKVGLPLTISRRVFTLVDWMQQRRREVYPKSQDYTYEPEAISIEIEMERDSPAALPDALQADQWALVSLRAKDLLEINDWPKEFGELFPVNWGVGILRQRSLA